MEYNRPIVMSIAGLDPTGGAGILADVKTSEQYRCLGFAAASALTVQTETDFMEVRWLKAKEIKAQAAPLLERYDIAAVKIGIMENLDLLAELTEWLKLKKPGLKLIWDPVISASSGFRLLHDLNKAILLQTLGRLELLTPNIMEARLLTGEPDEDKAAKILAKSCNVLLKGGHSALKKGTDVLYADGGHTLIRPQLQSGHPTPKHGSGCILSAAVTCGLALGYSLYDACLNAKKYTEKALHTNPNLLAYHA